MRLTMNTDREDGQLRARFAELRRDDVRQAPAFMTLARPAVGARGRHGLAWAAAAAVVVMMAGGAGWMWTHRGAPSAAEWPQVAVELPEVQGEAPLEWESPTESLLVMSEGEPSATARGAGGQREL
jgi:hypothetical protein